MSAESKSAALVSFLYSYVKEKNGDVEVNTYNSTKNNAYFETVFSEIGYETGTFVNLDPQNAFGLMSNSDVYVYRGHGREGALEFFDNYGTNTGAILANPSVPRDWSLNNYTISGLGKNALASIGCALYLGCNTAVNYGGNDYTGPFDGPRNIMEITYERGAHFVLGTTQTVYRDHSDKFLENFLRYCITKDVKTSIDKALIAVGPIIVNNSSLADDTGSVVLSQQYPVAFMGDSFRYLFY